MRIACWQRVKTRKHMTTNEIVAAARRKLLEESNEILDESTVLLYANQSYLDLQKRTFTNDQLQSATISFTNGVGNLPSDFGTLYSDMVDSSGNVYPEVSLADYDRLNGENGVAIKGTEILVSPNTVASLPMRYYPKYDDLSTSQNPEINPLLHECIIYGIMFRAYEDLQDDELSKFYEDKYNTKVLEKTAIISNYEEGAQRGGKMFNDIRLI